MMNLNVLTNHSNFNLFTGFRVLEIKGSLGALSALMWLCLCAHGQFAVAESAPNPSKLMAAGAEHTCIVGTSGTVQCWGSAEKGQLGDQSAQNIGDDEAIGGSSGLSSLAVNQGKVQEMVAGTSHTCALFCSGEVSCWGSNDLGQLKAGSAPGFGSPSSPPAYAAALLDLGANNDNSKSKALRIASGYNHTCAVLESERVHCWGQNNKGQLGQDRADTYGDNDHEIDLPRYAKLLSGDGTPVDVVTGAEHSCVLFSSGKVQCFGSNEFGQIGYGTPDSRGNIWSSSATSGGALDINTIFGRTFDARLIAAGAYHTCAYMFDASTPSSSGVFCWGLNTEGQLGRGDSTTVSTIGLTQTAGMGFSSVDLPSHEIVQLVAGHSHTCALLADGTAYCWGSNEYGQIGQMGVSDLGRTNLVSAGTAIATPLDGQMDGFTIVSLSAGQHHTCAVVAHPVSILSGIFPQCWGLNNKGQLGQGNTLNIGDDEPPSTAVALQGAVDAAAFTYNQTTYCNRAASVILDAPYSHAGLIATASMRSCAVLDGGLQCWGNNNDFALGYGLPTSAVVGGQNVTADAQGVVQLKPPSGTIRSVAMGDAHTCVLLCNAQVRCWGKPQLTGLASASAFGSPGAPVSSAPAVLFEEGRAVQISAGAAHTCVVTLSHNIACWGDNQYGQLGYGNDVTIGDNEHPFTAGVVDLHTGPGTALEVHCGSDFTCALLQGGFVQCWGNRDSGRLGYDSYSVGSSGESVQPGLDSPADALGTLVFPESEPVISLGCGAEHSCAITRSGRLYCWGSGGGALGHGGTVFGNIGDGDGFTIRGLSPVSIISDRFPVAVISGPRHSCVILDDSSLQCWGETRMLGQDATTPPKTGDNAEHSTVLFPSLVLAGGVLAVSAPNSPDSTDAHTCALVQDGSTKRARCWGSNSHGQLGFKQPSPCGSAFVGDATCNTSVPLAGEISLDVPSGQHDRQDRCAP